MDYTKNYHLPQWVKSDRIMMDDFNDAMSVMENGMTSTAEEAAAAVSAANNAVSTANSAKQTAKAAFSMDNKPYANGWYRGLGTSTLSITVGFKPSLVLIFANQGMADPFNYFSAAGRVLGNGRVTMTDTGFHVAPVDSDRRWPSVNEKDMIYEYFAFK